MWFGLRTPGIQGIPLSLQSAQVLGLLVDLDLGSLYLSLIVGFDACRCTRLRLCGDRHCWLEMELRYA